MTLSPERRGEIAIAILKARAREEGIKLGPQVKRRLPRMSKETGVSESELEAFGRWFVTELLNDSFSE